MTDFPEGAQSETNLLRVEAPYTVAYYAVYLAYLFLRLESEVLHWLTLVLVPLAWLTWQRRGRARPFSLTLASVGIAWRNLGSGLAWGAFIGLAASILQLWASRNRGQIAEALQSERALYLIPVTFLVMVAFAGFTEEFLFRGVLQTRLAQRVSTFWAVTITAFLFGLYHLPYAYLHPRWPSHGDWAAALSASFGQGVPAGLILGTLYARSKNNLLACVVCHALINTLPGMLQIKFGR